MVTATDIEKALERVHDESSFMHELLAGTLNWPIKGMPGSVEEISYGWTKEELRAADLDKALLDGQVRQLADLDPAQPWGVFLLEFNSDKPFLAERGMTGVLRKVLRGLSKSD